MDGRRPAPATPGIAKTLLPPQQSRGSSWLLVSRLGLILHDNTLIYSLFSICQISVQGLTTSGGVRVRRLWAKMVPAALRGGALAGSRGDSILLEGCLATLEGSYFKLSLVRSTESLPMNVLPHRSERGIPAASRTTTFAVSVRQSGLFVSE
jgi:hypothetical protein